MLVITTSKRREAREKREYLHGLAVGLNQGQVIGQAAAMKMGCIVSPLAQAEAIVRKERF